LEFVQAEDGIVFSCERVKGMNYTIIAHDLNPLDLPSNLKTTENLSITSEPSNPDSLQRLNHGII